MSDPMMRDPFNFVRLDQIAKILRPLGLSGIFSGNSNVSVRIPDSELAEGQRFPDKILRDKVFADVRAAFEEVGIDITRLPTTHYSETEACWRVDFRLNDLEDPYYRGDEAG